MITHFEIENFKAFSLNQKIKFAPITLIYGPNSSGKSSIIQALMMLKQTIQQRSGNGALVTSGDDISLSNFDAIIHGQTTDKEIKFSFEYKATYNASDFRQKNSYDLIFANNDLRTTSLSFNVFNKQPKLNEFYFSCRDKTVEKVSYTLKRANETSEGSSYKLQEMASIRSYISKRNKYEPGDYHSWNELDNALNHPFFIDHKINLPVSMGHASDEKDLSTFSSRIVSDIESLIDKLKYLGPLRSSPKRFYSQEIGIYQKGQGKGNLGHSIYHAHEKEKEKINSFLNSFNIPYTINAVDIGDINTGEIISMQLIDSRNHTTVTPKDVGFGIGQVLPIIIDSVVSKNKIICVEQPEIHLHPRLQAHLADLFIDSVSAESNNQWIIETHSEALMLRLQRRIREKKINQDLISIIYVDVGENGAQVLELPLDSEGDFTTHWPNGFFEERINEIYGVENDH
ncbi:AAA family ATPase [Aeromonas veronii]|uniref:AAA family ATPase n=1 Tax=Aeromonas veronii TaxID=654 RepID=UPI0018F1FCA0|nr:AAA family ATPase [Aeromonas veronii]MBJ7592250.1 AAA family ATPase [Aeromonas veronii]UBR44394.1 AAA family ATPase [Aeromonas veronii]